MTRAFLSGMRVHLIQFVRNPFDVSAIILWPIVYASISYYLLDAKDDPRLLLSASLGAAVMLMWSSVVIGSSGALEQQRWLGTLELVVGAPVPLALVMAPISVASGVAGAYALVATLGWGAVLFDVPLSIQEAARRLAAGDTLGDVAGLLATEAGIGVVYLGLGLCLLRLFEFEGRRSATLEAF